MIGVFKLIFYFIFSLLILIFFILRIDLFLLKRNCSEILYKIQIQIFMA